MVGVPAEAEHIEVEGAGEAGKRPAVVQSLQAV